MRLLGKNILKSVVVVFAMIGVVASVQQLRGQGTSPLEGAAVSHIGIMVKDIAKTSQMFEQVFGVKVPAAVEAPIGGMLPAGTPDADKSRVKFAQTKIGNMVIELIEPVAGPGPHRDHIDKFGQGLQHLAITVKDPKAVIGYLQAQGGKLTMANYVDLKDQLGFTAEVSGMPR